MKLKGLWMMADRMRTDTYLVNVQMRDVFFGKTGSRIGTTEKHKELGMNHHALIFAIQRNPQLR